MSLGNHGFMNRTWSRWHWLREFLGIDLDKPWVCL